MQCQKPKQGYKVIKSFFGRYEEIPEEWKITRLTEIAEILGRIGWKGLTTMDYRNDGPLFFSVYNISKDFQLDLSDVKRISEERYLESPEIIIKEHDILLSKSGTIGRLCYVENFKEQATINAAINIIRCNHKIFPKYLFYFLSWSKTRNRLVSISAAGAQPNLFQKDMKVFLITLPTPPEQQKITSILSNMDSLIQQTHKIIERTQELKKGLMQKLLTKGIGHTKFKKTTLGEIPDKWDLSTIGKTCHVGTGGTPSRDNSKYYEGDIPWVKTGEINYDVIVKTEESITLDALNESSTKKYPKGTLLFALYGQGITRGKCAILGIDAAVNQACAAIQPYAQIETLFLFYWLQSRYVSLRSTSQGSHQSNFNLSIVNSIVIPITSKKEQQSIISILSNVDSQIQKQQEYKSNLETLKKGLMQKLLTGQIRVKV